MLLKPPNVSTRKNVTVSLGYCLSQCDSYFELVTIHASVVLIAIINKRRLELQVASLS